ncbi:restriction endonuclease [Robertmurraya massiliosenegalensis]|uniref:restriction endonuclease n=1 Tax=Robertmurraya TaxID=2837507 RepID=UPI0039A46AAF
MSRKLSRKERQNQVYQVFVMFPILSIVILLIMNGVTNYFLLGGILLGGIIFGNIAVRYVPDMRKKENKHKNQYTGLPSKSKSTNKTTQNSTDKIESNSSSKSRKVHSDKELLTADIDSLKGEEFERLVFMYFDDKGYKPETTPKTGDHGVDLVITDPKDGLKIAVQCKRSKNGIGNADLIKLEGGKRFYKCPRTLFITTSFFTTKAKEFAESTRMDTWNGLQVAEKIGKWRKEQLKMSS